MGFNTLILQGKKPIHRDYNWIWDVDEDGHKIIRIKKGNWEWYRISNFWKDPETLAQYLADFGRPHSGVDIGHFYGEPQFLPVPSRCVQAEIGPKPTLPQYAHNDGDHYMKWVSIDQYTIFLPDGTPWDGHVMFGYHHAKELLFDVGAEVDDETPITLGNSTGYSSGNHLHYGNAPCVPTSDPNFFNIYHSPGSVAGWIDPMPYIMPRTMLRLVKLNENQSIPSEFTDKQYVIMGNHRVHIYDEELLHEMMDAGQLQPLEEIDLAELEQFPEGVVAVK